MSALMKGLLVAAAQVLLVASVGAKFALDRAGYPRVWAESAPYDPDLPIRGRYVSIALRVDVPGRDPAAERNTFLTRLEVRDDRLVAIPDAGGRHWVTARPCGESRCWLLDERVAFFIPEHVDDPSLRAPGEQLWVEVTVPPKGAPRPVRLGVKRGDAAIEPLGLR